MPTALDKDIYREIVTIITGFQSGKLSAHDFAARIPSLVDGLTHGSTRQALRLICDRITASAAAGSDITDDVYEMWDTIPAKVRHRPGSGKRTGLAGILEGLLGAWAGGGRYG